MNTISMDFGTYNSAVALKLPNGEVILPRPPLTQSPIIPSFLKFSADGEFDSFGEPAKNAASVDHQHVVWGLKRLLGLSYRDADERGELARYKYKIMDANGKLLIEIGSRLYTPIDLVTLFLRKVKESCESPAANLPLSGPLEKLVVTHPAYFDSEQTSSLKEAAIHAGYHEVELIREPEAAAIAYKDLIDFSQEPLVMVIDWGAGTLDFFIAHFFFEDGRPKVAPAAPAFGDTRLGGIDMDDTLLRRFKDIHRLDGLDSRDEARLRVEIEKAKIALSDKEFITRFFGAGGVQLPLNLVRSRRYIPAGQDSASWVCLEETLADERYGRILGKFQDNLRASLTKHNLTPCDIEYVILVGGPTCMPPVRAAIREVFTDNRAVVEQLNRFDSGFPVSPFEAVVKGAILREDVDVGAIRSAYTYGFMLDGKLLEPLVIERGTPIARGSQHVSRAMPSLKARAGMLLDISLYMKIETAGGVEHWRLGDYQFAPVAAAGRGTAIQPSLELSAEEICTLKMRDQVSGKLLTLDFKDDKREQMGEPEILHILGGNDIDQDLLKRLEEEMSKGEYSAEMIDGVRREALTYQRVVQQLLNERRQLPPEVICRYERLVALLPKVAQGKSLQADSPEVRVFQEMTNNLMELKKILKNLGYQSS
jgi:molecular chaperone DnaK